MGKTNFDVLRGFRRRSDAGHETGDLASPERSRPGIEGPVVDFISGVSAEAEAKRGNFALATRDIGDLTLNRQDFCAFDRRVLQLDLAQPKAVDVHVLA